MSGFLGVNVSQQADHMSDDDWERAVVHGFGMVNHGVALADSSRKTLPWWALFLDSCATYHSMFATKFLTEVHEAPVHLKGHCNAGVLVCEKQGYYGPFKMWLNPKGIANLLSIPQLEADGFEVDYATGGGWTVKTPKGECLKFKRGSGLFNGMPYIDLREAHEGLAMLATVSKNYKGYTERQVKKAILARRLQEMVAHPTDESFKQMVSNKSLRNSDIRVEDVTNVRAILVLTCQV